MMRARGSAIAAGDAVLSFTFEGDTIAARPGETIAAALTARGIRALRLTRDGAPRGIFCGMGVCQECLVDIAGSPAQRACMTKAVAGMAVRRHVTPARITDAAPHQWQTPDFPLDPDVLVIGGGAAGLTAAAVAAEAGARVVLVDERPAPGGQYFKQPHAGLEFDAGLDDPQFAEGRSLIARVAAAGVAIVEGVVVNAALPLAITVVWNGQAADLHPRRLIVATGAYERAWPVPGWTLPGVMTTGAAQTLLRSYQVLAGRRIAIAGNGPLNLQVAVELHRAGAEVVAVAETAPAPSLGTLAALTRMVACSPGLVSQGAGYLRYLRRAGVPVQYGTVLTEVRDNGDGSLVAVMGSGGRALEFTADAVCLGYGFLPGNEVLRLLGCAHRYDPRRRHLVTMRDENCETTIPGVYGAGDCCGLNGARVAIAEGRIAGAAASQRRSHGLTAARFDRWRHRVFQDALWQVFAPPLPQGDSAPDVVLCRCEGVTVAEHESALPGGIGTVKRATRLGMGRCQGRTCVPEAVDRACRREGIIPGEFSYAAPRPPIKPVPLSVLGRLAK